MGMASEGQHANTLSVCCSGDVVGWSCSHPASPGQVHVSKTWLCMHIEQQLPTVHAVGGVAFVLQLGCLQAAG